MIPTTITVRNQQEISHWLTNNKFEEPERILFKLLITSDEASLADKSIAEIHAHFVQHAIEYVETNDFFDDYDDFIVSSRSYFNTNDGEKLSYNVDISVEKEN